MVGALQSQQVTSDRCSDARDVRQLGALQTAVARAYEWTEHVEPASSRVIQLLKARPAGRSAALQLLLAHSHDASAECHQLRAQS
jgi:hypothetical protein